MTETATDVMDCYIWESSSETMVSEKINSCPDFSWDM